MYRLLVRCRAMTAAPATPHAYLPAELAGEPTATSNTLSLLWDEQPPVPSIGIAGKYTTTQAPKVPVLVAFGERVMQANPLGLFNTTGFSRRAGGAGAGCLDAAAAAAAGLSGAAAAAVPPCQRLPLQALGARPVPRLCAWPTRLLPPILQGGRDLRCGARPPVCHRNLPGSQRHLCGHGCARCLLAAWPAAAAAAALLRLGCAQTSAAGRPAGCRPN